MAPLTGIVCESILHHHYKFYCFQYVENLHKLLQHTFFLERDGLQPHLMKI